LFSTVILSLKLSTNVSISLCCKLFILCYDDI
jgi:hypothetical protein